MTAEVPVVREVPSAEPVSVGKVSAPAEMPSGEMMSSSAEMATREVMTEMPSTKMPPAEMSATEVSEVTAAKVATAEVMPSEMAAAKVSATEMAAMSARLSGHRIDEKIQCQQRCGSDDRQAHCAKHDMAPYLTAVLGLQKCIRLNLNIEQRPAAERSAFEGFSLHFSNYTEMTRRR